MALPLPNPAGPAGGIVDAMREINALRELQLKNQYYAPNIESEMASRNALTQGQNIKNQYLPEQLQLANAFQQLQNQYYGPNIQSEIESRNVATQGGQIANQFSPERLRLANEYQRLQNQFYPQATQADIESKKAMAQYRQAGGAGMGVGQKEMQGFISQLQNEHPDWTPVQTNQAASAYLSGQNMLPDGTPLPELSGIGQSYTAQIQKRGTTAAIQNQAANFDVLVQDLEDFDIDAVKAMAGPQGRAKLAYAKARMLVNPDDPSIDPMARRFISSMNQSIINMDSMRKAFGTSVVPDYVYRTIGRLTNPSDSIFNDPTQIAKNYQTVLDSIRKQRDIITRKARFGATAQLPSGSKEKISTKSVSQMTTAEIENELAQLRGGK